MLMIVVLIIFVFFVLIGMYYVKMCNHDDKYVEPFVEKDFLSLKKCKKIINYCNNSGTMIDSMTVGGKNEKVRNSKQYWITKENVLVRDIFKKVEEKYSVNLENVESMQVVRYKPGQYFKPHHDACCDMFTCNEFLKRGGQRVMTILIYLNEDFTGGNTKFPNLGLEFKPKPGSAIVFRTLGENSRTCHPHALHEGTPVNSGEKWIANIWVREQKFK